VLAYEGADGGREIAFLLVAILSVLDQCALMIK
jgi:hypothetical protein